MDPIDHEWHALDLAQLINDYEEADQAEYAEFMAEMDARDAERGN
ncbi:hypothetical protein ABZ990_09870 [Streptomyces sp. NPDC046203]